MAHKDTALPKHATVSFDVVTKMYAHPFPGQRSHRLHLAEAKYLKARRELYGDMLVFHAVRYRAPNKAGRMVWVTYLVDGYTRVEAVMQELMQAPKQVVLLTHVRDDYEGAYALYCQFNSAKAAKRNKHFIQTGVREGSTANAEALDSFESALFVRGPSTSGIRYSSLPGKDLRTRVSRGYGPLRKLDQMQLHKTTESSGMMAAYITIMHRDFEIRPELAEEFIRSMNYEGNFEPNNRRQHSIKDARLYHNTARADRRTSGTKNVYDIRDRVLRAYQDFLVSALRRKNMALRADMTMGQFMAAG